MDISVRLLRESDLDTADRIFRLAFGTLMRLPNPISFGGDKDYVRTRWRSNPTAAFGAETNGKLVGSNFVANWGSVGLFGPLTVHPDLQNQGVAQRLLEPTMDVFERWGTKHAGLYTHGESPKHIRLYQKYGFWPHHLTMIMSKQVSGKRSMQNLSTFSRTPSGQQSQVLEKCRQLTTTVYPGLDLRTEIIGVQEQGIGGTLLLRDDSSRLLGVAVCHIGRGSEAGSDVCYVKFGAVQPGPNAGEMFDKLLKGCEGLASSKGVTKLTAGVNAGRRAAYRMMLSQGFQSYLHGVAMDKPDNPGYNRPEIFVIDDWR